MKVTDHLSQAKDTLFSFEILPPLKGKSIQSIFDGIDPLMEFNPKFVNVTYHREEYIYKERDQGLLEKIAIRKRPGTVGICAAIMNKYNVDAVPHLICGGFSKEETENALIDLQFLGIDNVLALRGDSIKTEANFRPHENGHTHAVDLINQIGEMNRGDYLMDDIKLEPTDFCIGAAGYPEKHFEAMNLATDLKYTFLVSQTAPDTITGSASHLNFTNSADGQNDGGNGAHDVTTEWYASELLGTVVSEQSESDIVQQLDAGGAGLGDYTIEIGVTAQADSCTNPLGGQNEDNGEDVSYTIQLIVLDYSITPYIDVDDIDL